MKASLALALSLALADLTNLAACAGNTAEVERARAARYDADRAELVRRAAAEVRAHYGTLVVEADGTIKTAWHQVPIGARNLERDQARDLRPGEKWFIRFVVTISSARPSSIDVTPFASKWQAGMALPVELRGADQPAWAEPRADRLRLQIHEALAAYAR